MSTRTGDRIVHLLVGTTLLLTTIWAGNTPALVATSYTAGLTSLAVNGNSAYAEVAATPDLNLTGDWTVETWFKDDDPNGFNHDYRQILMKGDRDANPEAPYYLLVGRNSILVGVRTDGQDYPLTCDLVFAGLDPAAWHHVAVTFRADLHVLNLWLDGRHIKYFSVPAHSMAGNTLPLEVGRNGPMTGKYWLGKLADVRIWNIARTGTEITPTCTTEFTGPQPGLVANWHFNGDGIDSVGGHAAGLFGGATFSNDGPPTLTSVAPTPTAIDLTSSAPIQVARGSAVTDADGTRQATLLVPQGTTAIMTLANGTTQPLTSLHVRATEYTVSSTGPQAMPAELPAQSGYTYAVELSADEAVATGATGVSFSEDLPVYLDNFLQFTTGQLVPVGAYDPTQGEWIPSPNGRVVTIVGVQTGQAMLDVDGSGHPADATALATLGVTNAELHQLASLYLPGQSLWRIPVRHFSPWDFNWPFAPPPDAQPPDEPQPCTDSNCPPTDDNCNQTGSIIGCETQSLGEELELTGTDYKLHYQGNRQRGATAGASVTIALSGNSVPASLACIDLEVDVAGRHFFQSFSNAPNQTTTFTWDGLDAYGRRMQGGLPALVRVGYVYRGVYLTPSQTAAEMKANDPVFGHFSYFGSVATGVRERQEVTLWQISHTELANWDNVPQGLGGWSLDVHHAYDPISKVLHLGDGSQRSAAAQIAAVMTTVASRYPPTRCAAERSDTRLSHLGRLGAGSHRRCSTHRHHGVSGGATGRRSSGRKWRGFWKVRVPGLTFKVLQVAV